MSPDVFFNVSDGGRALSFIVNADKDILFLCDREYFSWFSEHARDTFYINSEEDPLDIRLNAGAIVVCAENNERKQVDTLKCLVDSQGVNVTVFGLQTEIHACISSRIGQKLTSEVMKIARECQVPRRSVVIFSLPRSGSHLLAEICGKMGIGTPAEHLRPNIVSLALEDLDNFDFVAWLRIVASLSSRNDIFSTKIISQFYLSLLEKLDMLGEMMNLFGSDKVSCLYLFRSDKYQQAISSIRARKTRVFQLLKTDLVERHEDFECSDAEIALEVSHLFEMENLFSKQILPRFCPALVLEYETLANNIPRVAGMVSRLFLSVDRSIDIEVKISNRVMRDLRSEGILSEFITAQLKNARPIKRYFEIDYTTIPEACRVIVLYS